MKGAVSLVAVILYVLFASSAAQLECPDGWLNEGSKCYKVFYGNNKRAFKGAQEVCNSYGSWLVMIKNQKENDQIGTEVDRIAGAGESYFIGLSLEKTSVCDVCSELRWSDGMTASDYQGFWFDSEPDDSDGGCVFSQNNMQKYVYDRPYAWSYGNCYIKRAFVCERSAAPEESFFCWSGGYVSTYKECDGRNDCWDASDELNCGDLCHFNHELQNGKLATFNYSNGLTCTWAIKTPIGTSAFVTFDTFFTEYLADFVTIFAGSVIESQAKRIDQLSGQLGSRTYRSHNNMMFIKFSSDSDVIANGFTGTYGSVKISNSESITLTTQAEPQSYTVTTFGVADTHIVIQTEESYQLRQMITLVIEDLQIKDGDSVMFFDGGSPSDKLLATNCNNEACTNYPVVYSTGNKLSIVLRTGRDITSDVVFRFSYRRGCYYETTEQWGTLFTPGFPANINYPSVTCTWIINVTKPFTIHFDPSSRTADADYNRTMNGDLLKIYSDSGSLYQSRGLLSNEIAGTIVLDNIGYTRIVLETSVTRTAKGLLATWSIYCPDPQYNSDHTMLSQVPHAWYYTFKTEVSCSIGYDFLQDHIPRNTPSVSVECGFMGIWKNYLQIPRCTPKYCGIVPTIENGFIDSSTGSVYGSEAVYKCYSGSTLVSGDGRITCDDDGAWSALPMCRSARCLDNQFTANIADGTGEITNGNGTSIGTIYTYSCNSGFEIVGEPFVFCQQDGEWTQSGAPFCKKLRCLLPEVKNGDYLGVAVGDLINFGATINVNCDLGYSFETGSPTNVFCQDNRMVTELPLCINTNECEAVNKGGCADNCHDTVGSYYCSCNDGYELRNDGRTCQDINECDRNIDNCDEGCLNAPGSYSCTCQQPYVLYRENMISGYQIPPVESGMLPTDVYHLNHSCVLIACPAATSDIFNGQLLTQRVNHRYGDHVEYQCDIGFSPRRKVLVCLSNGNWDGTVPTCTAAECPADVVGILQTTPIYTSGPISYGETLTLQCTVANSHFNKTRFCTYNKEKDSYELQGSPYECGVVDCGIPPQYPGTTNYFISTTLYEGSFEFTCTDNSRQGQTAEGPESIVQCRQEGYWDFGNLQCTGQSCLDPGTPAGGSFIEAVKSLEDKSDVKFKCDRPGYSLSSDITFTCQGTIFNPNVNIMPTCDDTEPPTFLNCPTAPILVNKYSLLRNYLPPTLSVTDNTGVNSFTVQPRNANSTYRITSNMTVVFRAGDFAGNQAEPCTIVFITNDDEPPQITCTNVRYVELETTGTSVPYEEFLQSSFDITDNRNIKTFQITSSIPDTITILDLYKTYTYTARVTDQADNQATCKGQVFIRPKGCSDVSLLPALFSDTTCIPIGVFGDRSCTVTCYDSYTFEDSKSRTVQCSNDVWQGAWEPACVPDVIGPVVICPQPVDITQLSQSTDTLPIDFTSLENQVVRTDLNTMEAPVFFPMSYTFSIDDLYKPKTIQVSVTDAAKNTGTCNFQYTVTPPVCSPVMLLRPQDGTFSCTRRVESFREVGWDCTITCQAGKILRNQGSTYEVSCLDGIAWTEAQQFPECIDDTKSPVITLYPISREEFIYESDDERIITFAADNSGYDYVVSDYSGIANVAYFPPTLTVNRFILNQAQTIGMTITDLAGNQVSSSFQVLIVAGRCSPLALPTPVNGQKQCTNTGIGYTCTLSCNPNYSFYGTTSSQITSTCSNNGDFSTYIPDCANDDDTTLKKLIGKLRYEYTVDDENVLSIDSSCVSYYLDTLVRTDVLVRMGTTLENMCSLFHDVNTTELDVQFLIGNTKGSVLQDGPSRTLVQFDYAYTILYYGTDSGVIDTCASLYSQSTLDIPDNIFPLSASIASGDSADGNFCPTMRWNNVAGSLPTDYFCATPYFESLTDSDLCVRCPAGTVSDGEFCTVCPAGSYSTSTDEQCMNCGTGYTTRYPGATGQGQCIALCGSGQVSRTGFNPCYSCQIGTYSVSTTQCRSCESGFTTTNIGSIDVSQCIDSSLVNDVSEPCSIGTEDVGNNVCRLCAIGQYRSSNTQSCVSCFGSTTTYFEGAISSNQCFAMCSNGFTSLTGRAPCNPCPAGQYGMNSTHCGTCQAGSTTLTPGSTMCLPESLLRVKCSRGKFRDLNTEECMLCPVGRYSAIEDADSCLPCDQGYSTYFEGATAKTMCRLKCTPGFFSTEGTGLSPCRACGTGRYSDSLGVSTCSSCATDETTITTTSTSSSDCIQKCAAGYFSYNGYSQPNTCEICPVNHYQPAVGATECLQCPTTTQYTNNPGSTSCISAESLCDNFCMNTGTCSILDNEPVCQCPEGEYSGPRCSVLVNTCASDPCYNGGNCLPTASGGYQCSCNGATGTRCENIIKQCDTSQASPTCKNGGGCINTLGGYDCFCREGFTGNNCDVKASICATKECTLPGTDECIDVSLGSNLRRRCICTAGWTGEDCETQINECDSNPCINGASCVDLSATFRCNCQTGYTGTYCERRQDMCFNNQCRINGDTSAECVDVYKLDHDGCICSPGYAYDNGGYTQYDIMVNRAPDNLVTKVAETENTLLSCRDECTRRISCNRFAFDTVNNKCYIWSAVEQLNIITYTNVYMYTKYVMFPEDDFYTLRYNLKAPDINGDEESLIDLNTIYGLNICGGTEPLYIRCCRAGDVCLQTSEFQVCNADGVRSFSQFVDYDVQFKCSINRVFQSNICIAKPDYCASSPCQNGQCTNNFGGYTCTCVSGYVGKNCQTDFDYCSRGNPCNNGGVCEDKLADYFCRCPLGYEGRTCASPVDFCENNNCADSHGFCRPEETGYTCICYAGYEGRYCDDEIDYCKSEPCKHGGACMSVFNGYQCTCVEGFQGVNCERLPLYCSLQQGSQCEGTCNNIFNGYQCSCDDNTYGTNCEFQPNPCRDYNKCQNDAVCSFSTSMTCTCPSKFTGDGCQILKNYCGKTNLCENDATCSATEDGYTCTCKPGYIGTNCETEIDECASVTCPGDGVCFDDIDKHYCSCPLKKTGFDCNRDYDRNYDLYFNRGHAWITHKVNNGDKVTVSLWVRYVKSGTTGVYFTDFRSRNNKLETSVRRNEFNEIGVKTYILNGYIELKYAYEATVNDGDWHFVVFVYDMVVGSVKLYLDTVFQDEETNTDLIVHDTTARVWTVLGCDYNNEERECYSDGYEFHGYLSQVNIYESELSFNSDIPYIFEFPRYIFEFSRYYLVLVWNGYELETGVSRLIPSEAHGASCGIVGRTPPCNYYTASTLPTVSNCPDDQFLYSSSRTVSVEWTEPTFNNLGSTGYTNYPDYQPGSTFTWGMHDILYVGVDASKNRVFCHFTIYVNDGQCQTPPDPYGGIQDCTVDNLSGRKGCMISCNNPSQYLIDRDSPELYTCGPTSTWNSMKPFQRFRYPSCGVIKPEPKVNVYMYVVYRIATTACTAVTRNVKLRTKEEFVDLQIIFQGDLCQDNSCSQMKIELSCNKTGRVKRQAVNEFEYTTVVEIWLANVDARTVLDGEDISVEEFLTYFILAADVLNFGNTIVNGTIEKQRFEIEVTPTCPEGQILRAGLCVECGPGNYFRYTDVAKTTAICDDCWLGSYQSLYGQLSCTECNSGFTTEMTGEYETNSCKTSCPIGQYFSSQENACANCPVGYYQDDVGQFRCKGCLAGFTTKEEGSVSSSQCSVSCDSGYELNDNGNCMPCLVGLYRNATESRICVPCTTGFINERIASTSKDDCVIVACEAGTYRDVILNECKDCPFNKYQPSKWKTECISCGSDENYRTENEGSWSISQCLYYCPSGYQVKSESCEICPAGTYKDNSQNIQGECLPCTGNMRTPGEGSTTIFDCTIYKCPVGQKPNAINTQCVDCPVGTYQDVEYSTDCKDCVDSYSTREIASNSSQQCELYCESGYEKLSGVCTQCKKGFFKNNADGLFEPCQECNSRFTTAGMGSENEDLCTIRTCPPGTKRNDDDSDCDACPIGTYQENYFQTECIDCTQLNESTRTEESKSSTDCEVYCPSGYEKASSGLCEGCDKGYYKNNDDGKFSICTLCQVDRITADINSVSADNCTIANCSAGSKLLADNTCQLCDKGQYQPERWKSVCIPCGVDKTTENRGADQLSDCILECRPGYEDIDGTCEECKRGFYKVENAAASCRVCRTGFTTETTGATSSDKCSLPACNAGSYLDRISNPAAPLCVPCPYDQYQDEVWKEQCKSCTSSTPVTLQIGADEETDCVSDCNSGTQYNIVSEDCEFCATGFYRNKADRQQAQCQLCPLDKITSGPGATDVLRCNIANCTEAGYYRDTTANVCRLCPLAEYNTGSTWWQTTCTPCPSGNSTRNEGSISIDDCRSICPLGQYVGMNNRCILCPRGTYRSNRDDDVCTRCNSGLLTPGIGTDTDQNCTISPCNAGYKYILNDLSCEKCAIGTYQPDSGKFLCIDCPYPILYTPSVGATSEDQCKSPCRSGEEFHEASRSCVPCPSGTYQHTPEKYTCNVCPVGRRYTVSTGSLSIDSCLNYCASGATNDCSANATCTVSSSNSVGYTCSCFTNYDDIGSSTGTECVHKCDRAYCKNENQCTREPQPRCACSKWYTGLFCETRVEAQDVADDTWDIIIPVIITALGLILSLIILAVCCLCWRSTSGNTSNQMQQNDFQGERIDKTSIYSYEHGLPYVHSRPQSRIMMLAPVQELTYDNMAYKPDYAGSVISTLDPAVYEA